MKTARKLVFVNYKGGVGKTSLIVNSAAALARSGKRVLLVDLDTQSNTSIWLLRLDRWNKINASGEGSVFSIFSPGRQRLKDIIVPDAIEDKAGAKLLPGLDLVPAVFNLVDLESEWEGDPARPPFVIFREQIAEVEAAYDYILFDCPPNILRASQCGVFSSQEVFVPCNPDALSLIGFTLLVEKLGRFHQRSASFRTAAMGRPAQVQGLIFNAIKANVDIEVPRMRLQLRLNQFKSAKRVPASARILAAQVRDATVVRRAVSLGLPVNLLELEGDPEDTVEADYRRVAAEIATHVAAA